ncbi:Peptidyl-prolyl cis-trans isomerase B [Enhygromyxa salina]|uniref:Peptidyl-prolyl cis-trans isomerase n=1 Tax=Enhygromyxa salina TaxID=215803 RepID=A0A2S9YJC7_9BACT|nr:peptidylprolyl isomerase [Enhygromyxa salina]PRQ05181.1 Peptidyl-prolyl cis-trans isomerase B [Enhygromyxa salina]
MAHRTSFPPVQELVPGDGRLTATFHTTSGDFTIELLEGVAPNTVSNFVGLATGKGDWIDPVSGSPGTGRYYDGVIFHRVIAGFMLQGGDRTGTGRGGPGYTFDDEPHPEARHDSAGVLSMANAGRRGGRGTNGSQFFVTLGPTPHLDGKHTVFGRVIDGLDVVKAIGSTRTAAGDRPIQDVRIETIDVARG